MKQLQEIFEIKYGVNLELINCDIVENGIPFVSRKQNNNGVAEFVEKIEGQDVNPAHTLSVATSGSVGSSFYHNYEYYSGRDVYILTPKKKLSIIEMLFYAKCIHSNKYKYSYGRQANKTLKDILIPEAVPDYLKIGLTNFYKKTLTNISSKPASNNQLKLRDRNWGSFLYDDIFNVLGGFYNLKPDFNEAGDIPFIGASYRSIRV